MTFRRETAFALTALALWLTGCSKVAGDSAAVGTPPAQPEVVRLLEQADQAMAAGQLGEASDRIDAAMAIAANNPEPWVARARLALRSGAHLDALEAADRALALGPDHAPALLLRALMVRDAHGFAASLPWFESAVNADPANPDIWAEYAATLGDGGAARAMLEAVRSLAEIAPADPRVPWLQAVLAARGGEYTIARSLLTRSRMAERGIPAAMQLDAVISLAEGNADSAAVTLETLAARQPANARVRELLARAMIAGGRAEEVIARFAPEAARPEASPYMLTLLARAYERIGDRQRAAPLLARAHAGVGDKPDVLAVRDSLPAPTTTARGAGEARSWAAAQAEIQALRERLAASADVAALSGDVLLGAGDPQAALAAYAQAARVKRPWPLTRKAAYAYDATGHATAADALLVRHVAGEPGNPAALVALAERFARHGDWARAAALLDHAAWLGAGHDPRLLGLRLRAARGLENDSDAHRFARLLAAVQPRSLVPQ